MNEKKEIAPSLEDLSYVLVENSGLFGFTNISGKALALVSLGGLGTGVAGAAQYFGYLGAVAGGMVIMPVGAAALGVSVATGLLGYWLGNFDDKAINAHNSEASNAFARARGKVYDRVEKEFVNALSKVTLDPKTQSLPHDALGHAVLLKDSLIEKLPPEIQIDIYRTQADIELYKHKKLVANNVIEGRQFETVTLSDSSPMEEKAQAFKQSRNYIREALRDGTLKITPIVHRKDNEDYTSQASNDDEAHPLEDMAEAIGDVLKRSKGRSSSGWGGGGGSSGGAGSSVAWDSPRVTAPPSTQAFVTGGSIGSLSTTDTATASDLSSAGSLGEIFSSSSSGNTSSDGGFDLSDIEIDKDSAGPLLIAAGAAAIIAAAAVSGVSLWKNFMEKAQKPTLGNVPVPMITKSLATVEKDIRQMYTPA